MKIEELNEKYKTIKENNIFKADDEKVERWDEPVENHPIRNNFQRDRDRILYSRAFRRLSGKTQVFTSSNDDHLRTRLTHTLEVSQIARTISKELGLDEDLTEAIALGHDLGHTPFGDVGERTLNQIMNGCYRIADFNDDISYNNLGFKHNLQGVRVITDLEETSLNLTKETIWGIVNHSSKGKKECLEGDVINCNLKHKNPNVKCCRKMISLDFYDNYLQDIDDDKFWTLEGLVVAFADEIAQRHHDIEDGIEFKILSIKEVYDQININFKNALENNENKSQNNLLKKLDKEEDKYTAISIFSKFIVDFLTTDLINQSKKNLIELVKKYSLNSMDDFYMKKQLIYSENITDKISKNKIINFSMEINIGDKEFHEFLYNRILNSYEAQRMDGLGSYVITKLFEAYTYNPQQLRDKSINKLYRNIKDKEDEFNQILNSSVNENEKEFIESILKKFKTIKNTGDKRSFIVDLHYRIMSSDYSIEKSYKDALMRTICDYISGMTDKFALNDHKSLYNN